MLTPEYTDLHDPDRERITLRDLLMMRSGLRWPYKPYLSMARQMEAAPDPDRFVLEQPIVAGPERTGTTTTAACETAPVRDPTGMLPYLVARTRKIAA